MRVFRFPAIAMAVFMAAFSETMGLAMYKKELTNGASSGAPEVMKRSAISVSQSENTYTAQSTGPLGDSVPEDIMGLPILICIAIALCLCGTCCFGTLSDKGWGKHSELTFMEGKSEYAGIGCLVFFLVIAAIALGGHFMQ